MKGFLHVSEAIVVIMLVFVMLFQFTTIPQMRTNWERSKLILISHDLLYSLDRSGIDWYNATEVAQKVSTFLPGTIAFSVSTVQDVKPVIRVACVCDPENFSVLQEQILTDFDLNGMRRRFVLERVDPANMKFSVDNDVVIFWGCRDLGSIDSRNLMNYLNTGGGVVEFSSLGQGQAMSPWHQEVFNLKWVDSTYSKSNYADFYPFFSTDKGYDAKKFFFRTPYELSPEPATAGYWRMNTGRGDTAWDTSSRSNDGVLMDADGLNADGDKIAEWVDGKFGKALLFDGTDDYVEVPDSSYLKLSRYTTEAWFMVERLPVDEESFVILEKGEDTISGGSSFGMSLVYNSSMWEDEPKIACSFRDDFGNDYWLLYRMSPVHTGNLVHLACTLDGNDWRMYVNGADVAASVYSGGTLMPAGLSGQMPSLGGSPLYIGARYDSRSSGLSGFFKGIVDEVIVYGRDLLPEEISVHYERRFPAWQNFVNFVSGSLYPMDDVASKIIVEQESSYIDGAYRGKSVPLAVISWGVEEKGRSAWMSAAPLTPENKQLLKSLVIWSSGGKEHEVVSGNLHDSVKATLYRILNTDMFEIMKVDLILGYYY